MFMELTVEAVNQKWVINIKSIAFFYPYNNGTRIYFIGDDEPLDVKEDYETVISMITKARF